MKEVLNNFSLGLQKLFAKISFPGDVSVLSIGFGNEEKLHTEIHALKKVFKDFTYTGIDIQKRTDIKSVNGVPVKLVFADATKLDTLKNNGINENTYDVVILRHPEFFNETLATFSRIMRRTVPTLLRTGGIFIISVFNENEKAFIVKKPGEVLKPGPGIMQTIYENLEEQQNSLPRAAKVKDPTVFADHFMFWFKIK